MYKIYIDGAASNNQDPLKREGGFAFILLSDSSKKAFYKYCNNSTNNQMELSALLYALKHIKSESNVSIFTDSKYVIGCFSGNKVKKNLDLVFAISNLIQEKKLKLSFCHVTAHNGDFYNEMADSYAKQAIEEKNNEIREIILPG